jgi:cation transport ATPase
MTLALDRLLPRALIVIALAALLAGGAAWAAGDSTLADWLWAAGAIPVIVGLVVSISRDLLAGRLGVDAVALLSMIGALALSEFLAAIVVAVMYAGGNALEEFAVSRAERDIRSLIDRAPRVAHRERAGEVDDVPVSEVAVGDRLLVRAGEVLPVDGVLAGSDAVLDESALTGEPIPVMRRAGEAARSGAVNAGQTFVLVATATEGESTYAGIVRMATAAQTAKSPTIRMADRFALLLLPVSLALAGIAWGFSGDPVRGLAVLVTATPADPRRSGRLHCGRCPGGASRNPDEGRARARGAGADTHRDLRQDGHVDGRRRAHHQDRDGARLERRRDSAHHGLSRTGFATSRGGGDRRCGARTRA